MATQKNENKRAHLEAFQDERQAYEQLLAEQAFLQDCKDRGHIPRWP